MENKIAEALKPLKTVDIYSIVLFALFKLKDDPRYSTLSELCYLLDNKGFINLMEYYGGMTIKVPTLQEFKEVVDALCLYDLVNCNGEDYNKAVKKLNIQDDRVKELAETYKTICEVLKDYDFRRS